MVGAYDWDGGVLKEGASGRIVPAREAFESEFPLELKNHAAYLGTFRINVIFPVKKSKRFIGCFGFFFFLRRLYGVIRAGRRLEEAVCGRRAAIQA